MYYNNIPETGSFFRKGRTDSLNPLTYLFPALTVTFTVLFFLLGLIGENFEAPSGKSRLGRASAPASVAKRTGRPWGILALTAVYALIAFFNLGDTASPETYYALPDGGRVEIRFAGEVQLGRVFYFAGLNTGEAELTVLQGGREIPAGTLPHAYRDVFKWRDAELTEDADLTTDTLILYPHADGTEDIEIGEMAFFDVNGHRVDPSDISVSAGAEALCDEPMAVPDASTWRNSTYFDEIYHARTALEHLRAIEPYEVSHPPLGKLIIALGLTIFGVNPFGWRFMGVLFGVLMLPVLWLLIRRLFGDDRIALCGTAIFAFDFMHFAQTRIATIDTYGVFFILLMYLFFWSWYENDRWRDLALAGVFFGLGAASKWTCLYAGAGLGVLWIIAWLFRFHDAKGQSWQKRCAEDFVLNVGFCLVWFVLVPALIYYLSYTPYGLAKGLAAPGMYFTRDYLKTVLENQSFMFTYHAGLIAEHPYSSSWWQWLFDIRPILYYLEYGEGTVASIGAFTNPLLSWAGLVSVVYLMVRAVRKRDRRAVFIVVGYLAQLVPWMLVTRLTFAYHYFAAVVFLVLALCAVFDDMRAKGHIRWMYAFTGVCLALFAAFYPVLTGIEVARNYSWKLLKWFPSWPF